jgi:meiotically up-regulated gene 157 (Mug157) protein
MVWPLGVILEVLTATNGSEIRRSLDSLRKTLAGTGIIHEACYQDEPKRLPRSGFVWAKTNFGEFVLKILHERPQLLR